MTTEAQEFDCVPTALRERPQWVCWRSIERGGKPTKCPINASTGRKASSTDPTTWTTFENAVATYRSSNDLAGIGFVFSADDPFAGIDLDDCIDDAGTVKPWAASIIADLNSYVEISPSGNGVKVFVRASKKGLRCKRRYHDGAVEMYDRGRFFTVTGFRLPDSAVDVEERQTQFDSMYARVFAAKKASTRTAPPKTSTDVAKSLDDEELIAKARGARNGERVAALFDRGDTSAYNNDDSAADLALCCILAFWTRDAGQLDRLFRRSALMRDKWDEKHFSDGRTYGQATLDKALELVTETYRPTTRGKRPCPTGVAYRATPSGLMWDKQTQHGDVPTPLANFNARIVADVSRDDGVEATHVFTIEAELHGRRSRFDIPSGRFSGMGWVADALGARAIVYPGFGTRDHTRAAIQLLSEDVVSALTLERPSAIGRLLPKNSLAVPFGELAEDVTDGTQSRQPIYLTHLCAMALGAGPNAVDLSSTHSIRPSFDPLVDFPLGDPRL